MMETDPLEILSLYQYSGTRHSSVLSFQSVQTAERLLDKLELSPEDEGLLEVALKDGVAKKEVTSQKGVQEKGKKGDGEKEHEKKDGNDLLVCLPASGFPSLKNTCFTPREILRVSLIGSLGEGLCTMGEPHLPSAPRCSYFVEEIDSEDGTDANESLARTALEKKSPFGKDVVKENIKTEIHGTSNTTRRNTDNKTEKYHIDTSKPFTKSPSSNNSSLTEYGQSLIFKWEEGDDSMYESSVKRNNSSSTTNVGSRDSIMGGSTHILNAMPSGRSDNSDGLKNLVIPTKNGPVKNKAEKNSFHLKNLFRSRKSLKRKGRIYTKEDGSNAEAGTPKKSPESLNGFFFRIKSGVLLEDIPSSSSE